MTLTEFLKSKRAYKKFVRNIKNAHTEEISNYILNNLKNNHLYISESFLWDESPEGYDFWDRLDDEFLKQ